MRDIFILGATKYSFMIHQFIDQEHQYRVLGHTVNEPYIQGVQSECEKRNVNIYPLERLKDCCRKGVPILILNTLGYTDMNRTREKLSIQCKQLGYNLVNFISNRAIVLSAVSGEGNIIFPGAYIGTDVTIGDNNVFYSGVVMTHDITIGNNNFIAANVTSGGEVEIGNNCFIGMGSTLRNRIKISDYSLIGASSYLSHSTRENEVIVPAKSITLDKNSFEVSLTPKS